jgi:nitrate/nitrite transporter NarK
MKINRWVIIIILGIASGLTFLLPYYFKYLFIEFEYKYSISSVSFKQIYTFYGFVTLLSYIPGGYLADKYSARKLISFSLLLSGITGLFTTLNLSFPGLVIAFSVFAISNTLLFWVSSVKLILNLGNKYESGRILGVFEGSKGIAGVIFAILYFFFIIPEKFGIDFIILTYSILNILLGILIWYLFRDLKELSSPPMEIPEIIKNKKIWIIGILIFFNYILYSNMVYTNNYLYDLYRFSETTIILFAYLRIYALKIIIGPLSGYFVDKLGSAMKLFMLTFFLYIFTEIVFISTPSNAELISFIVFNTIIITILSLVFNTIFFALIPEFNLPINGKIIGFISVIGFLPDIFYYKIGSNLIKTHGPLAYKYFFLLNISTAIMGLIFTFIVYRWKTSSSDKI